MSGFKLYLATGINVPLMQHTFNKWDWQDETLNILLAFPFIKHWDEANPTPPWPVGNYMLDSGAFGAWKTGKVIDFDALCEEVKNPRWTHCVALDVIGDGEASLKNALEMKARGLNVIPVHHYGEPWDILLEYKKHFPYIGLGGGGAARAQQRKWVDQCFARVWPHKVHMFGCTQMNMLMQVPFYSADSTSWEQGIRWGTTRTIKGMKLPRYSEIGIDAYNLCTEIKYYVDMARKVRHVWAKELAQLETANVIQ